MFRTLAALTIGAIAALLLTSTDAATPSWVGGYELMGPAVITDWRVNVDLDTRDVTVTGIVENRSNVTLRNVTVGIGDEETAEVRIPDMQPGESQPFAVSLHTGTNLTVRGFVYADASYTAFAAAIPATER